MRRTSPVRSILHLHQRGARYAEIVVLYRTNAQSEAFQRHFTALEIPFTMREEGDFYARREVQGILSYLNFFEGTTEKTEDRSQETGEGVTASDLPASYLDEWLLALLNVPNRKISRMTGAQLRSYAEMRGKRIWDILSEYHADDRSGFWSDVRSRRPGLAGRVAPMSRC